MKIFEMAGWGLVLAAIAMVGYGLSYYEPQTVYQKSNLVCFDMTRNLRLRLVENDIRFDGNIIRFTNDKGDYAIYPPEGWLCSIIKVNE